MTNVVLELRTSLALETFTSPERCVFVNGSILLHEEVATPKPLLEFSSSRLEWALSRLAEMLVDYPQVRVVLTKSMAGNQESSYELTPSLVSTLRTSPVDAIRELCPSLPSQASRSVYAENLLPLQAGPETLESTFGDYVYLRCTAGKYHCPFSGELRDVFLDSFQGLFSSDHLGVAEVFRDGPRREQIRWLAVHTGDMLNRGHQKMYLPNLFPGGWVDRTTFANRYLEYRQEKHHASK